MRAFASPLSLEEYVTQAIRSVSWLVASTFARLPKLESSVTFGHRRRLQWRGRAFVRAHEYSCYAGSAFPERASNIKTLKPLQTGCEI